MKIGLGCDHGGYNLKIKKKQYIRNQAIFRI